MDGTFMKEKCIEKQDFISKNEPNMYIIINSNNSFKIDNTKYEKVSNLSKNLFKINMPNVK